MDDILIQKLIPIFDCINLALEKQQYTNSVSDGLKLMNDVLYQQIKPVVRQHFIDSATSYRTKRDEQNIKLFNLMNRMNTELEQLFIGQPVQVKPMSSLCAKMNLLKESDIDFGILITDLNDSNGKVNTKLYNQITEILTNNKFVFSHIFNPTIDDNRYFSFVKFIDGIEIEAKVRDYQTTLHVLELHNWLDTQLSEDDITLFTYIKYLLKIYDSENNTIYYKKFKKVLYEAMFFCVNGQFLLPLN